MKNETLRKVKSRWPDLSVPSIKSNNCFEKEFVSGFIFLHPNLPTVHYRRSRFLKQVKRVLKGFLDVGVLIMIWSSKLLRTVKILCKKD
jgi:hypothetical protein